MLGSDVVMVQSSSFIYGKLNDFLGPRSQADVTRNRAIAATDNELHGAAHLVQLNAEVGEHLCGDALTFAHESEQEMLSPYVVMVEPLRFFLC